MKKLICIHKHAVCAVSRMSLNGIQIRVFFKNHLDMNVVVRYFSYDEVNKHGASTEKFHDYHSGSYTYSIP